MVLHYHYVVNEDEYNRALHIYCCYAKTHLTFHVLNSKSVEKQGT